MGDGGWRDAIKNCYHDMIHTYSIGTIMNIHKSQKSFLNEKNRM